MEYLFSNNSSPDITRRSFFMSDSEKMEYYEHNKSNEIVNPIININSSTPLQSPKIDIDFNIRNPKIKFSIDDDNDDNNENENENENEKEKSTSKELPTIIKTNEDSILNNVSSFIPVYSISPKSIDGELDHSTIKNNTSVNNNTIVKEVTNSCNNNICTNHNNNNDYDII